MDPNSEGWETPKAILERTQLLRTTGQCPDGRLGPCLASTELRMAQTTPVPASMA